jgi:hypothetical protein
MNILAGNSAYVPERQTGDMRLMPMKVSYRVPPNSVVSKQSVFAGRNLGVNGGARVKPQIFLVDTIPFGSGGPKFGDFHRTLRLQTPKIRWDRYETIPISRGPETGRAQG